MAVRFPVLPLFAAVAVAHTGCVGGGWGARSEPTRIRTEPVPVEPALPVTPTKITQFADVLRVPGQQVPLNGDWTGIAPEPPPVSVPNQPPRPDVPKPAPPPDPPLVAALREYLAGRSGADHLRQLDPASYEYLTQLLPAVAKLSQTPPSQLTPKDASELMRQFDPTLAVVSRRAPLRVEKAVFCKDVKGYGKYDPLPDGVAFDPGKVYILYLEVGNVPNEPDGRGGASGFATRLDCTVGVKDEAGRPVELADQVSGGGRRGSEPVLHRTKSDFSRSPVRDYYAVFWFSAPSKPGAYAVTFEVRDPTTARAVSKSLAFRVQ